MFNPFKSLSEANKMRGQVMEIQKKLAEEKIELDENGVHLVVTGDQKIITLEINGASDEVVKEKVNKALKMSQEMATKRVMEMSGGLQGLLGQG